MAWSTPCAPVMARCCGGRIPAVVMLASLPDGGQLRPVCRGGKRCRVYELRASSGSPLWQAQAGTIGAMVSTLLVIKSLAYVVNSGDGTMDTLGASTSAVRWWYSLGQPDPG